MRERELERILVDEVQKSGGRAYKWVSPGNDGVPDRIVFLPDGKIIFVEMKTKTGKLSAQQKIQINRLQNLGADVRVVKGIIGVIDFMLEVGMQYRAHMLMRKYIDGAEDPDEIHTA